jgi:hypothetical protein
MPDFDVLRSFFFRKQNQVSITIYNRLFGGKARKSRFQEAAGKGVLQ